MHKEIISSQNAPKAVGPYSQAVLYQAKHTLELSGQIGIDPQINQLVSGGIEAETKQTLDNIGAVLAELGWNFANILKSRIYLVDMGDYKLVNEIYAKRFSENQPARIAIGVNQLPLGARIEIECVAGGDEIEENLQKINFNL